MDAFEKWSKDYFNEHGLAPTPKECFRAGMRAAAAQTHELAESGWNGALSQVRNILLDHERAILAEADKP